MKMMSDSFYKKMFLCAGIWNILIALPGLIAPDFTIALSFGADAVTENFLAVQSYRFFIITVLIFGAGYILVSVDLMLNRGIVWLGLSSKIILFVFFTNYYISDKATLTAMVGLTGDLIWAFVFLLFIHQTRNRVKVNTIVG
jgi:hypothetical protein